MADKKRPRVWNPDLAKRCAFYPKTPEEYEPWRQKLRDRLAEQRKTGRMTRAGVRDGWGGKSKLVRELNARAQEEAKAIVADLKEKGVVTLDDERAEAALTELVTVMQDQGSGRKDKIAAAKAILDFTKKKPSTTTEIAVRRPEDFLAALAAEGDSED